MCTGLRAAEHVTAAPTDTGVAELPEELRCRGIDTHNPAVFVHLDDRIRRTVNNRGELLPFAIERLAQLSTPKRDRQLMTRQLDDPDSIWIEARASRRPQRQEALGRLLAERQEDRFSRAGGPAHFILRKRAIIRCQRRRPGGGGRLSEESPARFAQQQRAGGGSAHPNNFGDDHVRQIRRTTP